MQTIRTTHHLMPVSNNSEIERKSFYTLVQAMMKLHLEARWSSTIETLRSAQWATSRRCGSHVRLHTPADPPGTATASRVIAPQRLWGCQGARAATTSTQGRFGWEKAKWGSIWMSGLPRRGMSVCGPSSSVKEGQEWHFNLTLTTFTAKTMAFS